MPEPTDVLVDGPWIHRDLSANGVRLHVAEAGAGPLVVLLHGYPEMWWAWRHQLVALADAGYRAVAVDLRGCGASDKTPRGYDAFTAAADVAGLVRALGETDAMLVGHDWGGLVAWSTATLHPRVVRRLVVVGAPHPLRLRREVLRGRGQRRAARRLLTYQLPRYPERLLTRDDGAYVEWLLQAWAGAAWRRTDDYAEAVERYRSAMCIPQAAYGAMEYFRWALRSMLRADGQRYARLMTAPVTAPTLQLHGVDDPWMLARTASGSGRYVAAAYEWRAVEGVGHFPPEEAPDRVNGELVRWAKGD